MYTVVKRSFELDLFCWRLKIRFGIYWNLTQSEFSVEVSDSVWTLEILHLIAADSVKDNFNWIKMEVKQDVSWHKW